MPPIVDVVFLVVAFACGSAVGRGHQVDLVPNGGRVAPKQQRQQGETSQESGVSLRSIHVQSETVINTKDRILPRSAEA